MWLPTFGLHVCIKRMVTQYITFELLAGELVHFDRRCANVNSTWQKIIDVWRMVCCLVWVCCCRPLLLQGAGFLQRADSFFWKGSEATLRKKPNAKEHDMKNKADLISGVPWGNG